MIFIHFFFSFCRSSKHKAVSKRVFTSQHWYQQLLTGLSQLVTSASSCFPSDETPHASFTCWLRRGPYSPEAPQQAPFAPARTVLTEKTHLPCIVENFINSNLCHSDEANTRENIWALYKSITQVVRKICSHAIWIGRESAGKGMDLFLRGWRAGCSETPSKTGHAVHITKPQSQTNVLFKEPKRCLLQSA